MGLCNVCMTDTPEKQKIVERLLALTDFYDCPLIECLIAIVARIMLEMLLLPVIMSIRILKEFIICYNHVFGALYFRVGVPIVIYDMSTPVHHFAELECLLGKGAGTVVFARDGVRNAENMETEFLVWRWLDRGSSLLI